MKDMHGNFEVEVYLLSSSQVTAKQFTCGKTPTAMIVSGKRLPQSINQ
jgi:hypothetical protein